MKSCEYFFSELAEHWFEEDTEIDLESFDLNEPSPEPQVGSKINKEDAEDVVFAHAVSKGFIFATSDYIE